MNKIFECIVGSHAYGTNIETSDIDIKGVYMQTPQEVCGLQYQEQINLDKDTTYYEIKRFVELACSANPTILEMLFVDERFIKISSPPFQILRENRSLFLTQKLFNSFGGYAVAQIKKAKGLNKKMNWEKEKTIRKTPFDFCYIQWGNGSIPVLDWLKKENLKQEYIGLSAINHMPGNYILYYDYPAQYGVETNHTVNSFGYKGIQNENSNEVLLSSIPKEQVGQEKGIMYFNKDAYSIHCKDYSQYQEWLKKRNVQRYTDTTQPGQQIDGKNMMHCVRLLETCFDFVTKGELQVFRNNANNLIKIRKGGVNLNKILSYAEELMEKLNALQKLSKLPEEVNKNIIHDLLTEVRFNGENGGTTD